MEDADGRVLGRRRAARAEGKAALDETEHAERRGRIRSLGVAAELAALGSGDGTPRRPAEWSTEPASRVLQRVGPHGRGTEARSEPPAFELAAIASRMPPDIRRSPEDRHVKRSRREGRLAIRGVSALARRLMALERSRMRRILGAGRARR